MARRVFTISPMPPEKCAYALARYSRSPDSIRDSIEWVRTHDSAKFLESFYFQYGHASIADLGHVVLCFEGISELAATETEDEQLWDGQARSSRYQDFSKSGFVTPPEFDPGQAAIYQAAAANLLAGYNEIHARMFDYLAEHHPRPESMKPDAYQRNLKARAFDVARYLLCFGIPTGVGQVTSIRTLERQVRRLKASEYTEVRDLAVEIAEACAAPAVCSWGANGSEEAVAPTLARHVDVNEHLLRSRKDLEQWAHENLAPSEEASAEAVDLLKPADTMADIVATLLYPVTHRSYRALYQLACGWSSAQRNEVVDVALRSKTNRDELLRNFRGAPYVYDIVMDIGAYRDLHRHRRCQQFRQPYSTRLGFATPDAIHEAGISAQYSSLMSHVCHVAGNLPEPGSHYLLPFATKSRFLFKMDFPEAEYISRLRSGVKGHFSYRRIAWEMKEKMAKLEPELGRLMDATPPWVEDPLQR
ncbi:MAG TPA: FAD-dependent thymidylate synthase [Bryobacteraceae bacterium]|jgi:thymidylate synthase ThyX|nr:FAD-dependent thymidylate synthase [Bryobacteraceae bacterium]